MADPAAADARFVPRSLVDLFRSTLDRNLDQGCGGHPAALHSHRPVLVGVLSRRELLALTFSTSVLAVLLLWGKVHNDAVNWTLWGCCLILIVWICIRQGLRGGCFAVGISSCVVLSLAQLLQIPANELSGMQGNLL